MGGAGFSQNITTSSKNIVYAEPQLLMVDPEFLTDEKMQGRIQANIESQTDEMRRFQESGVVPKEVLEDIRKTASGDLSGYSPEQRGLALRNRAEAAEIADLLRTTKDPRQIPALVNRVKKHFAAQAFRTKGEIGSVAIPDSYRYKIRSRSSAMAGSNMESLSSIDVISSGKRQAMHMVNFETRGKEMIVADDVVATYKSALGTFDMDDYALPTMKTFRDADGRTRIGFVAMRDPKGASESFVGRANFRDQETLTDFLGKQDERIVRQFKGATSSDMDNLFAAVTSEGVDAFSAKRAIDIARAIITSNDDVSSNLANFVDTGEEEARYALETVVRIVQEGRFRI
jgi:hypothetical protein